MKTKMRFSSPEDFWKKASPEIKREFVRNFESNLMSTWYLNEVIQQHLERQGFSGCRDLAEKVHPDFEIHFYEISGNWSSSKIIKYKLLYWQKYQFAEQRRFPGCTGLSKYNLYADKNLLSFWLEGWPITPTDLSVRIRFYGEINICPNCGLIRLDQGQNERGSPLLFGDLHYHFKTIVLPLCRSDEWDTIVNPALSEKIQALWRKGQSNYLTSFPCTNECINEEEILNQIIEYFGGYYENPHKFLSDYKIYERRNALKNARLEKSRKEKEAKFEEGLRKRQQRYYQTRKQTRNLCQLFTLTSILKNHELTSTPAQ